MCSTLREKFWYLQMLLHDGYQKYIFSFYFQSFFAILGECIFVLWVVYKSLLGNPWELMWVFSVLVFFLSTSFHPDAEKFSPVCFYTLKRSSLNMVLNLDFVLTEIIRKKLVVPLWKSCPFSYLGVTNVPTFLLAQRKLFWKVGQEDRDGERISYSWAARVFCEAWTENTLY